VVGGGLGPVEGGVGGHGGSLWGRVAVAGITGFRRGVWSVSVIVSGVWVSGG